MNKENIKLNSISMQDIGIFPAKTQSMLKGTNARRHEMLEIIHKLSQRDHASI